MASTWELNRKLDDLKCVICELKPGDNSAILEAILEAILNNTAENENNLQCSQAKACDADCNVVICHTCYDVEGTIVSTSHTNPDGTPFTGDLTSLDLGCTTCGKPECTILAGNSPNCCSGDKNISVAAGNQCIK